jgi:uncharacterized protein (DUF39 family)
MSEEIITSDRIETEESNEQLNVFIVVGTRNDMGDYIKAVAGVFATESEANTYIGLLAMDLEEGEVNLEVKKVSV